MWKYVWASLTESDSCSPSLLPCLLLFQSSPSLQCTSLFPKTLLYCSFSLHCLSLHIWPILFLFPPLLFLFGRFNAFTPPLHSCGCFIHQSTALFNQPHGIFVCSAPPPTPSPPTITHGLSLEACTLPAILPPSSFLPRPWRSHSYSYFGALLWNLIVQRMYIPHISTHLGSWWSCEKFGNVEGVKKKIG